MKFSLLVLFFIPLILFSQIDSSKGIKWINGLSWEQIKQKAKAENKYIFIDAYATWCAPCKVMDREIFPLEEVGKFYNEKFICLKVQADQNSSDNDQIKDWYKDAAKVTKEYKVQLYPTFLFLSSDDSLIHRFSGRLNASDFLTMGKDALDGKGYATLVSKFKKGDYENLDLKELAVSAKYARDDSLAKSIATAFVLNTDVSELMKQENMLFVLEFSRKDKEWVRQTCMPKISSLTLDQLANPAAIRFLFLAVKNDSLGSAVTDHWLASMKRSQIFKNETLLYLKSFVRSSGDQSFQLLMNNQKLVDKIMGNDNWAREELDMIILKEEFYNEAFDSARKRLKSGTRASELHEPDWSKLHSVIEAKYGSACASRLQFKPRISWYNLVGDKKGYTKHIVLEMEQTDGWNLNEIILNANAMEVFTFSTSKKEVLTAAKWMKKYFEKNPDKFETDAAALDTYATLLYKAGMVDEGIRLQEKAKKINPDDKEISNNLIGMKSKKRIWSQDFDLIK